MVNTGVTRNKTTELFRKVFTSLRSELNVTTRMLADNVWIVAIPGVVVSITAAHATAGASPVRLAIGLLWSILLAYAFEAANQAVGADEDALNKPHRPIPIGLATPKGMWLRAYISFSLYIAAGAFGGVISFVVSILYIALIIWVYLLAPKRWYYCWKPVVNGLVVIFQISGPWAIIGQYNLQVLYASIVCGCVYMLPGQIEDARDMEGDHRQGRVTLATIFGARASCRLFGVTIALVPVVAGIVIWKYSAYSPVPVLLFAIVCGLSWVSTFTALQAKSSRAYRRLFHLFCLVQLLFTTFYCSILW